MPLSERPEHMANDAIETRHLALRPSQIRPNLLNPRQRFATPEHPDLRRSMPKAFTTPEIIRVFSCDSWPRIPRSPPSRMLRPLFLRYAPWKVAAVGGLIAIVVSVVITSLSVRSIGFEEMTWGWTIFLAILCPGLIAPPIVYVQCCAYQKIARQKQELADTNARLHAALARVDELSQLLPVCAWCHRVRDDSGYWERVEAFLERNTRRSITHGVCPDCRDRELAELDKPRVTRTR